MVCSFMFVIEGQTDLYESCTGKLTMSVFKMELPRSGLLEQGIRAACGLRASLIAAAQLNARFVVSGDGTRGEDA